MLIVLLISILGYCPGTEADVPRAETALPRGDMAPDEAAAGCSLPAWQWEFTVDQGPGIPWGQVLLR
jgi:hypothetical protein